MDGVICPLPTLLGSALIFVSALHGARSTFDLLR
jgi:hypothetical protein